MDFKIETEKYEVVNSGSILIDLDEPIFFKFDNETLNFKIIFNIIENEELPKLDLKLFKEENYLQVRINFPKKDKYITSTLQPVQLAKKHDKEFFLKFRFKTVFKKASDDIKKSEYEDIVFNYSWLLKK